MLSLLFLFRCRSFVFVIGGAVWPSWRQIAERAAGQERRSGAGRKLRDAVRRDDGAQCFSRRPNSRHGGEVASWRTAEVKERRAMQLKEDSRTDPRWAWLRQGSRLLNRGWTIFDLAQIVDGRMDGPGWRVDRGGLQARPRRTWEDQKTAQQRRTL
ncbi:hypothetical protein HDV63DRAFT_226455 [Trichoderma sp. SZMC 28014]